MLELCGTFWCLSSSSLWGVSSFEKFVVVKSCYSHLGKSRYFAKENSKEKGTFIASFPLLLWGALVLLARPPLLEAVADVEKGQRRWVGGLFFSILVCAVIMADDYNTVNTTAITRSVFAQENTTSASLDDNGGKSQVPKFVQVSFYQVLT